MLVYLLLLIIQLFIGMSFLMSILNPESSSITNTDLSMYIY
jgi:hypothetical protein